MLAQLLDNLPARTSDNRSGYWSVVRLCIDMAAQEWLNVGIVLDSTDGQRHYQLLDNLAGLRCLYNDDAVDSARFLLDQAEHVLETGAALPNGWHIALSAPKFAQGESVQSILTSLFYRLVPMGRHQLAPREDREDHPHATMNVRKTVRQLMSRHLGLAKTALPEFWRNAPTTIRRNGADILMDAQVIGQCNGMQVHGAVASAWYKMRYHRNASLSQAVNAMTTASEAFPSSTNVLYLLSPPSGLTTLTDAEYRAIAQDIESNKWLLEQRQAVLKVVQSEEVMADTILRDMRLLPEVA